MNQGWFKERENHAKARKGIKVRDRGNKSYQNPTLEKKKLSNRMSRNITKLDRKLRRIARMQNTEKARNEIGDAEKVYESLGNQFKEHKKRYGGFPEWVSHDWINNENFKKNGKVKKILGKMKKADKNDIKKLQRDLFNSIAIGSDRRMV